MQKKICVKDENNSAELSEGFYLNWGAINKDTLGLTTVVSTIGSIAGLFNKLSIISHGLEAQQKLLESTPNTVQNYHKRSKNQDDAIEVYEVENPNEIITYENSYRLNV